MRAVAGPRSRWRAAARTLQVALASTVATGVWLGGCAPEPDEPAVAPDTTAQFSLDLEVLTSAAAPMVYAVEQRATPHYRIFSVDPASGALETILAIPEGAIVYGIDVDTLGSTLAIAYAPDLSLGGSGLWTLDLDRDELTEVAPVVSGVFLTDPEWDEDGASVLATRVDRRGERERLDIVVADIATGAVEVLAENGVDPTVDGDVVHYLGVDPDTAARHTVRSLDRGSGNDTVVASGDVDLDHLLGPADGLKVAMLVGTAGGGLTLGAPAAAHGSHEVPSTWWDLSSLEALDVTSTVVFDADLADGMLVAVTREGLTVVDGSSTQLIASRALRFVTAADA